MNRIWIVFFGLFFGLFGAACGSSGSADIPGGASMTAQQPGSAPPAGSTVVNIPMNAAGMGTAAYGQNPLSITAGTTVTWVNQDQMPHTATSDTGAFDSGTLAPGQNFSFQFKTAGNFPYHCTIHGAASMSGMIQVH